MLRPLHKRKNILLHGLPGTGKTTLVERLVERIPYPKRGFYTREVRERGRRVGFQIVTLEGQKAWLAKRGKGYPQVGKYRVFIDSFERLALPTIEEVTQGSLLVIDEIGKMELFSEAFKKSVEKIFASSIPVLATAGYGKIPFLEELFSRKDTIYAEVAPESRDHLVDRVVSELYRPGLLVVLEGIDGSGKSTLARELSQELRKKGYRVFLTFEPTKGEWGQKIREHLSSKSKISPQGLAELFLRDRKVHVKEEILPRLKKGWIVLIDRYYLSTLAYQGAAGLDIEKLKRQNETWAPVPDVVIYLHIPVKEALQRLEKNPHYQKELFEKQEFLLQVENIYQKICPDFTCEFIEANIDKKTLLQEALKRLDPYLKKWQERSTL